METILFTKSDKLTVKTVYFADSQEFGVVLEYSDGSMQVVEKFKSVLFIMQFHDFWCKYTGIIEGNVSVGEIEKHLKSA